MDLIEGKWIICGLKDSNFNKIISRYECLFDLNFKENYLKCSRRSECEYKEFRYI